MSFFSGDIDWSQRGEDALVNGLQILVVIVLIYIGLRIVTRFLEPAVRRTVAAEMQDQSQVEYEKRVDTLTHVLHRTAWLIAILIALMMILPELGINTSALIAGTSLIGFAVGFGAQNFVKDVIAGIFILVENQYGKGDVVNIAGVGGLVEDVNLRRTVLRDLDGAIHSVPNGEISVASNLTRTWSRANFIVGVSYGEDMDHVFSVINRVGQEMASDPAWSKDIVEAPKVLGIENFNDSSIDIRVLGVTQPIRQWDVMRELRRRLKAAFDAEDIEIPYPHRTIVTAGTKAADGMVIRNTNGGRQKDGEVVSGERQA